MSIGVTLAAQGRLTSTKITVTEETNVAGAHIGPGVWRIE